jgi:quercetin 2,3-dioxygenase
MYLAEQRGISRSDEHITRHHFSFGAYQQELNDAAGSLSAFNDEMLAGGKACTHVAGQDASVLIIPVLGKVTCACGASAGNTIEAGDYALLSLSKGSELRFSNPYPDEIVNYLHAWVTLSPSKRMSGERTKSKRSLLPELFRNQLLPLVEEGDAVNASAVLGQFDGRKPGSYQTTGGKGVFVFIVEGAFEVQNRLLHSRDALVLQEPTTISFEALSNDAIILIMEYK